MPAAREIYQQVYEIAKFLHSHKRYNEVELLNRKAIACFDELGSIGDWLACQCFLGHSLQLKGRDEEGMTLSPSTLAISLLPGAHD
jgi:hypothetical protein